MGLPGSRRGLIGVRLGFYSTRLSGFCTGFRRSGLLGLRLPKVPGKGQSKFDVREHGV